MQQFLKQRENSQVVINYIKPLFTFADYHIPKNQSRIPLYWYSTAGMRLVSPLIQARVYQSIKDWVRQHTRFKIYDIKTISGRVEGVYRWLSANYKRNKLDTKKLFGVLDMGGASTQIVFPYPVRKATAIFKTSENQISLYSHSFLGLGRNEARHQFSNESSCFQRGFILPNGEIATGNLTQCIEKCRKFLEDRYDVNATIPDIPNLKFIAFDGFYDTAVWAGFRRNFTISALRDFANKRCKIVLKSDGSNGKDFTFCFNAAYFQSLLSLYGFPTKKPIVVEEGSWTAGLAVKLAVQGAVSVRKGDNYGDGA